MHRALQGYNRIRRVSRAIIALSILSPGILYNGLANAGAAVMHVNGAKCLWDKMPATKQDELISAYAASGLDALHFDDEISQLVTDNYQACGFTNADLAPMALTGYEMVAVTSARLSLKYGISAEKLDAAWNALSPDVKSRFLKGQAPGSPEDDEAENAVNISFAVRFTLPTTVTSTGKLAPDASTDLVYYAQGRAFVENAAPVQ